MQIKTVSYQRVLNLGNFESKRLELCAEIQEGEDPDLAATQLIERVESKIREDVEKEIVLRIEEIKAQRRELQSELRELKNEIDDLKKEKAQLSNSSPTDDIPGF